ncbi:cellulose synthase subunit BcsC-related outer membrane protein [Vulgatibacter sp.]|uniref:cellulose synthase subunit BcsC-related outer membrane protein n=1 Tax=Vulgatibacter sp. TaxID=1971226 RepID=UPI00356412F2
MTRKILIMLLAALALPEAAPAQSAREQLLENARYWEGRGREDKAIEAWEKVLLSDPRNADALVTLGLHHARAGRTAEARSFLDRLRSLAPGHAGVGQLEQALKLGSKSEDLLGEARRLGRSGDAAGAVAAYRQLFGEQPPPQALALEFYQTLGGTPGGWDEARSGLSRLAAQNPTPRVQLALAQHLTYRESTRREGIRTLEKLAVQPVVAAAAQQSWKQALLWLEAQPGDVGLFDAYGKRYPLDTEIGQRARRLRAGATGPALQAGFRALERADVKAADKIFRGAGRGPEALVGQALVAMEQRDFDRARALLEQVKAQEPRRPEMWERSLRSATFWGLLQEGDAARSRQAWEEAQAKYVEAAGLELEERYHAQLALGHMAMERERATEAAGHFAAVLAARPEEPDAMRGLVAAKLQTGAAAEAAALNQRLLQVAPEKAYPAGWVAAEQLRGEAKEARLLRDFERAQARLEAAETADPGNEWVLHDLANLHLETGHLAGAREVLDRLLAVAPQMTEIRVIQMRLLAAEGAWSAALDLLHGLPAAEMTPELAAWKRRLELQARIEQILVRRSVGDRSLAREELQALQPGIQDDPELLVVLGRAWATIGEGPRAAATAREVLLRTRDPAPALRLQLASILFEAKQEPELVAMLRELAADRSLSPSERLHLQGLRIGHGVRVADRLREEGAFSRAFSHLSPLVQEYPDDPALLCGVGRLYRSAGQDKEAHAVFLRVLREHPGHFDARQGAVETAVSLQLHADAERLALEGIQRAPKDPRSHLIAGRAAVAAGRPGEGVDAFRRAEVLATGTSVETSVAWAPAGGPELSEQSSSADILRRASMQFMQQGRVGENAAAAENQQLLLAEIDREIEALQSRLGIRASATPRLRFRDGEDGLGKLTAIEVPFELKVPLGYQAHVGLHVTPVSVSSGPLARTDTGVVSRFGSGLPFDQDPEGSSGGTAIAASYRTGGLLVDLGSTPLGFAVQNLVGGLEFAWADQGIGLRLDVERRAVTDSVLSWAGVQDPVTGKVWGAVVRTGGRLDLSFEQPDTLFYLYGGYHLLTGEKVVDNRFAEAGAGAEWGLYAADGTDVTVGMGISALSYAENQRYFTRGHGGYFSPQAFVRAGVPLRWTGESGRIGWNVLVDPGVNWFQEDAVDYFPEDAALQAAAAGAVDGQGNPIPARYEAKTSMAFSFNAEPRLYMQVNDFLQAGLLVGLYTGEEYKEVTGGLFLEGTFMGRKQR